VLRPDCQRRDRFPFFNFDHGQTGGCAQRDRAATDPRVPVSRRVTEEGPSPAVVRIFKDCSLLPGIADRLHPAEELGTASRDGP